MNRQTLAVTIGTVLLLLLGAVMLYSSPEEEAPAKRSPKPADVQAAQAQKVHLQHQIGRQRRRQAGDIGDTVDAIGQHVDQSVDGTRVRQIGAIELLDMFKCLGDIDACGHYIWSRGGGSSRGADQRWRST